MMPKSCPFCGEKHAKVYGESERFGLVAYDEDPVAFSNSKWYKVVCSATTGGCGASTGAHYSPQDAWAAWDERV